MNIEKDITWIHQEIDKIENPKTIRKLKNLLEFINHSRNNSINSYNLDLENSTKNIKE